MHSEVQRLNAPQTFIIVPVYNQVDLTKAIVEQLREQKDDYDWLYIYDHRSSDGTPAWLKAEFTQAKEQHFHRTEAATIHTMWNDAWRQARIQGGDPVNILFLNNDIIIPSGFVREMVWALRSNDHFAAVQPRAVRRDDIGLSLRPESVSGDQGLAGWAFGVKGELWEALGGGFDERFRWWYGETDLARRIAKAGFSIARADWIRSYHYGSASSAGTPEGKDLIRHGATEDRRLYEEKWADD